MESIRKKIGNEIFTGGITIVIIFALLQAKKNNYNTVLASSLKNYLSLILEATYSQKQNVKKFSKMFFYLLFNK